MGEGRGKAGEARQACAHRPGVLNLGSTVVEGEHVLGVSYGPDPCWALRC